MRFLWIGLGIAILVGGGFYLYASIQQTTERRGPCLANNEYAEYPLKNENNPRITTPATSTVVVSARDAKTGEETGTFQILGVPANYYPIEIHRCGIYAIREFNLTEKLRRATPEYRNELWKYFYNGSGTQILTFSETDAGGKYTSFFNDDFRIDFQERYIALVRGYLGQSDYALIIKDLKTLDDVLVFPFSELEKRNAELIGDITLEGGMWTPDGRYFWADTHYGATTLGFIRVDTATWKVDVLPAPKGTVGGDALNAARGLTSLHEGYVWIGIEDVYQLEKEKLQKEGIGTTLYIFDLFTQKRHFVSSTTEPLWYFQPQWISDIQLQYVLPSGEKKTYTVL